MGGTANASASDRTAGLVAFGGRIKSLGGNRVGGHLVLFGSPGERDTDGQYFTKGTDFWGLEGKRPVIYHHGFTKALGARRLGDAVLKLDDAGVWLEGELEARGQYERKYVPKVLEMVKAGKLGWSSGSAPHLVDVAEDGEIRSWPIVEASLTPTPADPRTRVVPLKSLLAPVSAAKAGGDVPATLEDLKRFVATAGAIRDLPAERRATLVTLARELDMALGGLRALLGDQYYGPRDEDLESQARAVLALL